MKLTIILLIIMIAIALFILDPNMHKTAIDLVLVPCGFVLTASVVLILEMLLSLLKIYMDYFLSSFLFYPVLLLGSLMLIIQFRKPLKRIK